MDSNKLLGLGLSDYKPFSVLLTSYFLSRIVLSSSKFTNKFTLLVLDYVADIIITGSCRIEIQSLISLLNTEFSLKD